MRSEKCFCKLSSPVVSGLDCGQKVRVVSGKNYWGD